MYEVTRTQLNELIKKYNAYCELYAFFNDSPPLI